MMTSLPTPLQQTPQKNVSALSILTEVDQYPYRNKLADTYIRSPTSLVSVFFILVFSVSTKLSYNISTKLSYNNYKTICATLCTLQI